MDINQRTIDNLKKLREKKKFTDSDWDERGLNPSDPDIVNKMILLTDRCLDELLADLKSNATEKQLRETLTKGLKRFETNYYDTEEKEFICDEFHNIASVLGLDIGDNLDDWLYGKAIGAVGLTKSEEVVFETKSWQCNKCESILDLKVTAKRTGVPNCWIIGQCLQCGEYNLLSTGENVGGLKFENFISKEILNGNNNSEERAKTRLEQLRQNGRR